MSRIYEYTVISSRLTTPTTLVLTLYDAKRRRPMTYDPGQYAVISFSTGEKRLTPARCFSIMSSPTEAGFLQFGIRVGGGFTKTAQRVLQPGSKVVVEGPFGHFVLNPTRDRSTLLLAGGIGVTPFISMIRYATRLQLQNEMMLLYSCRSQDDIPFLQELLELKQLNAHFNVMFFIGSGPIYLLINQYAFSGRIDGQVIDKLVSHMYEHRSYFICGPPAFMQGMSATLQANGAPPQYVFTEAFSQGQIGRVKLVNNVPLQVYALTGISLVLGTATVTGSALVKSSVSATASSNLNAANSRQATINQTIANLQSNPTSIPAATQPSPISSSSNSSVSVPNTTTPSSPTPSPSPQPASSPSPVPSPMPSPSPTPSPAPSPAPSPSPTPSPSPSPSPVPPPPPSVPPSLTFYASPTKISQGQSSTLFWGINPNATQPVTCTASGAWSGGKPTSGSQNVVPASSTSYGLTCRNSAGSNSGNATVCVSTPSKGC